LKERHDSLLQGCGRSASQPARCAGRCFKPIERVFRSIPLQVPQARPSASVFKLRK
jgi:hypothetical protein